ncbi:hypothetical protein AC477_03810 [miscellaneous Crenarchaeota group-1 archaeon SG8-32-1]|jgi:uncharacterized protein YdhG (YjbR/CyaY superfamily)|uniref:YdhG-like domain-containing protein n=1 Tax=miscellaneous Crenarchaeota group-1 archaeon SG8-32-1 TaxID=1685124 RepID=A0A0M0BTW9_9ARCH|nr:MAG: hypothetical protein AC477_03810 [miscellaneous Crenarchaeota group-1 archaeon SG8-32-1]
MEKQINDYIEKQKSPQKEIIQKIRKIFKKTLPNCEEKMRWGVITFGAGKFYLAAMKNRVHVGFAITGLNKDEVGLFEGTGKTMRHIKISKLEDIDQEKLAKLIEIVNKKTICESC